MSAKTPLLRGLFIQTEPLFHTAIAALFSTMQVLRFQAEHKQVHSLLTLLLKGNHYEQ